MVKKQGDKTNPGRTITIHLTVHAIIRNGNSGYNLHVTTVLVCTMSLEYKPLKVECDVRLPGLIYTNVRLAVNIYVVLLMFNVRFYMCGQLSIL